MKNALQTAREYQASLKMRRDKSVSNLKKILMTTHNLNPSNKKFLNEALRLIEGIKI